MNGFLGSAILETAIGIALLYLLLAVFCTAAVEWIAALLTTRANILRNAIARLIGEQMATGGTSFLETFYAHPIIAALVHGEEHPSYLSPRAFSTAILDLALAAEGCMKDLPGCIKDLPEGAVRTALVALVRRGEGDLAQLQTRVEAWFDDAMHRASCRYQKQTKVWTLVIAAGITLATNADTFQMLRQPGHLPGWNLAAEHLSPWGWLARLTGWLLTVGAVSLGAPFWFDVVNRFVNLRNTGRPAPTQR